MTISTPTMNKYRRVPAVLEALEAQPGFREAYAVWEKTGEMETDLLRKRNELPESLDPDTILDSGTLPKDWLTSVASVNTERENLARQMEAVTGLKGRAEYRLEAIATDPDPILSTLGGRMSDVVSRIGEAVAALGTASTPVTAIEQGQGTADAWRELATAKDEYSRLRDAQQKVMITSAGETWRSARMGSRSADGRVSFAIVRNLHDVFPQFSYLEATPWPEDETEFLVWCVRNGAELWLPTARFLSEHVTNIRQTFYRETQALAAQARKNISDVVAEIKAGNVHPYVQVVLKEQGVL